VGLAKTGNIWQAVLIFHFRVGCRVALRIFAPVIALVFASFYILRPEFFTFLAGAFFAESGRFIVAILFAAVVLAASRSASLRILSGLDGWFRHLPIKGSLVRRSAALSVFAAVTPILALLVVFAAFSVRTNSIGLMPFLIGYVLLGLAAAETLLPTKRPWVRWALGGISCGLCATGKWFLIAAGAILIVVLDQLEGPIVSIRKRPVRWPLLNIFGQGAAINFRAMSWKIVLPYVVSLLGFTLIGLFMANNVFDSHRVSAAARFGGTLSISAFLAYSATLLASKRPPWPWARALPLAARRRIITDAVFLGVMAGTLLIPLLIMNSSAVFPVAIFLPFAAVRAAAAIRQDRQNRFGAWGQIFLEGSFVALIIGLWAWSSVFFAVLLFPALKSAANSEKRQKVSLWFELRHLAAGDPQSWSSR
jgi:hypothetical protein